MQPANNTKVRSDNNNSQQLAKMIEFWNGKPFAGVDNYIQYSNQRFYFNSSIKRDYEPLLIDIPAYRYPITVPKCLDNQEVLVAVISTANNFEKRETIRQTWLHRLNSSYAGFAFVVALTGDATIQQRIEKESKEHGDIIQINFKDHYHNLTLKAVGLLNWVSINCPKISYLFKCDDDVYVNLPNFSAFLNNVPSKELAIYGNYMQNPPQRYFVEGETTQHHNIIITFRDDYSIGTSFSDKWILNKWILSAEEWPWSTFPLYFSGLSVLITGKSLNPLLDAAKVTPFFWIDDVYVTGILSEIAGVTLYGSSKYVYIVHINGVTLNFIEYNF